MLVGFNSVQFFLVEITERDINSMFDSLFIELILNRINFEKK